MGTLASNTKRSFKFDCNESILYPGKYNIKTPLSSRNNFSMTYSAAFHPPIARVCEKDTGPSPNQYHAEKYNTGRWNNVSADSAFKSRSFNRAVINMKEVGPKPSPCHYNVNDRLTHERIKEPVSYCFKSVTGRAFPPKPNSVPGPAKYRPNEPIEPVAKMLLPHQHYLRLAAPPVLKPDKTVYPGPTTYDIPRSLDNLDKCRQSAAFILPMSGCALQFTKEEVPSPTKYCPRQIGHKSFHCNEQNLFISQVWQFQIRSILFFWTVFYQMNFYKIAILKLGFKK